MAVISRLASVRGAVEPPSLSLKAQEIDVPPAWMGRLAAAAAAASAPYVPPEDRRRRVLGAQLSTASHFL